MVRSAVHKRPFNNGNAVLNFPRVHARNDPRGVGYCGIAFTSAITSQWRRLHGARGHVPPLLQMAGHGGTVSRRTTNNKLTKVYWPSRKRSPKRLIVLLEPKSGGARPKKNFFRLFAPDWCPRFCSGPVPPTFTFVPAPLPRAEVVVGPVLNALPQNGVCFCVTISKRPGCARVWWTVWCCLVSV